MSELIISEQQIKKTKFNGKRFTIVRLAAKMPTECETEIEIDFLLDPDCMKFT